MASKLMNWAIEQADMVEPAQAMYLESAPTAREVYLRFGFEPIGEANFVRRGPRTIKCDEDEGKVNVGAVENEIGGES